MPPSPLAPGFALHFCQHQVYAGPFSCHFGYITMTAAGQFTGLWGLYALKLWPVFRPLVFKWLKIMQAVDYPSSPHYVMYFMIDCVLPIFTIFTPCICTLLYVPIYICMYVCVQTQLDSDIWNNSLTGSSQRDTAGSLNTSSQPSIACLSLQSDESPSLPLAQCMLSVFSRHCVRTYFGTM